MVKEEKMEIRYCGQFSAAVATPVDWWTDLPPEISHTA